MSNSIYNVTDYQIKGDGETDNTQQINLLIASMEKGGGGTIYFPAGKYVSGTIELKSDTTLYLDAGATILGSSNQEEYPIIDCNIIKGWHRPTHSGFIKALNARNITVKGRGILDGRGYNWWHKVGDERPRCVELIGCENVLIEGIKIINSPMWTLHPVCCNNVTIHNITIKNPPDSPNTDGINPDGCSNVHISDCTIDVGDDCVTFKSGTQDDLYIKQHPCENITITNCTMIHGHGGVVIGSEMSGGVKNVVISNCIFHGTDRGIRIKTRRLRGGTVENIRVNNVIMDDVFSPIVISGFYKCGTTPEDYAFASSPAKQPVRDDTPVFRDFYFSNLTVQNAVACACYIEGLPEMPVDGIMIDNFTVKMKQGENVQPQNPAMTFESVKYNKKMKGKGMFIANAQNVTVRNIMVYAPGEICMTLKNCSHFSIDEVLTDHTDKKPVFSIKDSKDIFINLRSSTINKDDLIQEENCENVEVK